MPALQEWKNLIVDDEPLISRAEYDAGPEKMFPNAPRRNPNASVSLLSISADEELFIPKDLDHDSNPAALDYLRSISDEDLPKPQQTPAPASKKGFKRKPAPRGAAINQQPSQTPPTVLQVVGASQQMNGYHVNPSYTAMNQQRCETTTMDPEDDRKLAAKPSTGVPVWECEPSIQDFMDIEDASRTPASTPADLDHDSKPAAAVRRPTQEEQEKLADILADHATNVQQFAAAQPALTIQQAVLALEQMYQQLSQKPPVSPNALAYKAIAAAFFHDEQEHLAPSKAKRTSTRKLLKR